MCPGRWVISAAVLLGGLALLTPVASANWSGTYSIAAPRSGYEQENNYNCGYGGTFFGTGWDASNNLYVGWADTSVPAFSLPTGATLVGALLGGSVLEYNGYGGVAPAGTYRIGSMAGQGSASNAGNNPGCNNIGQWGGDGTTLWLPGNLGQTSAFSIHAYHTVLAFLNGSVPFWLGRPLAMQASSETGAAVWLQVSGPMSLQVEYAYRPPYIDVSQVQSGNGTQVTLSWGTSGNAGDIRYLLQRETLSAAGVAQNWMTLYQGAASSFTTSDQGCGRGYVYRVEAVGQDAATSWTTSGEWDEYPCSVSLTTPASVTNYVNLSWPAVTSATAYYVVWCQSDGCSPQWLNVGSTTSAQLTGLAPNTEYTIWICSTSNTWGCPVASGWTYAAVPRLNANNTTTGLSYNQQPVTWDANGNPPGTIYVLQQITYAPNGAWQDGAAVYRGTDTHFTADQTAGASYAYNVWAINAGYGSGTAGSNTVATQVASAPSLTITGTTTAQVSWSPVADMSSTWVGCEVWGTNQWITEGTATGGSTSLSFGGLSPNTEYYCATTALASNQGIQWWQGTSRAYTEANAPAALEITDIAQSSMTATWNGNSNPAGTRYQAVLEYAPNGGAALQRSPWTTTTSWTFAGLTPGSYYEVWVAAESGSGQTTAWTLAGSAHTVPNAPANFVASAGGLGWSASSGRGYVTLAWSPSTGASGYDVWISDGMEYEQFDVGSATTWDSRSALIYPPDLSLYPDVSAGSRSVPILSHNGGGLNLRDRPLDLYCSTAINSCSTNSNQHYWFGVSAYNASGNSSAFAPGGYACGQAQECQTPTPPLQTDPAAPDIIEWSLNNGGAYTYSPTVPFALDATESPSGIAAYALSNDGSNWTTTVVGGCAVGQSAACQTSLAAVGNWSLLPGPGSKTVWARAESTAGVWSVAQATTVYVNVDQTVPTVNVTLDGGAASTSSTSVSVAVSVSDPVANQDVGLTWKARYSTDGGQTWSAWQAEGSSASWSTTWTIPGGASGPRTLLAQVENDDHNLGQGGATVYFAAPDTGGGASLPSGSESGSACTWPLNGTDVTATCVTSSQVTVPLMPPTGALQMRVSLDNATWGPWRSTASSVPVDLGSSAGAKTVWVEYQDNSGGVTAENPAYYVFDPAAPSLQASWAGNASATDPAAHATLDVQAADDVGSIGMTIGVTENGAVLYAGAFENSLELTMEGSGYQMVQVTVADAAGNSSSTQLGIYVQ